MIQIPTFDEQVSLCKLLLQSTALKQSSKKFTPETMNICVSDEVFIIAVNQISNEPLSELELYFFNKNVLKKNEVLLIKSTKYEML